jgi:hypothetical protein
MPDPAPTLADASPGMLMPNADLCEVSAGLRKSGFEAGGGSEAVALGHPVVPVRDGFASRFVPLDR